MTRVPSERPSLRPVTAVAARAPYHSPERVTPVDLRLNGNEGAAPPATLLDALQAHGAATINHYPSAQGLQERIAERFGLDADRVLVTAGGDDALQRACRALVEPGRQAILPTPTFEMFARFIELAGGESIEIPWPAGPFPVDACLAAAGPSTSLVVVVSPNNPTGLTADIEDIQRLSRELPGALVLADLAYVEFADSDPTAALLELPNVLVARTLSKGWGLAGLRVGYALGSAEVIRWLRTTGLPYSVSGPSLALATAWFDQGQPAVEDFAACVRSDRDAINSALRELGIEPLPSQGNFVAFRYPQAAWLGDALAGLGISIRTWADQPELADFVRIGCPGDGRALARLLHGLKSALAPEALLLDMDGVLVDVRGSYRECIRVTARSYGVEIDDDAIAFAKRQKDSNNDWAVTRRLLAEHGVDASLEEVTRRFEVVYHGTEDAPGLWRAESLLVTRELLERLKARMPLAIVTGRPRLDAERLLEWQGLAELFEQVVCLEDTPKGKPDPAPVRLALERLGLSAAWMVGDTPDDARAARTAGVVPVGILPPGETSDIARAALLEAGAGRIIPSLDQLLEVLP